MQDHTSSHRVAVLNEDLCKPRKCGLECIVYCPVNKTGGECIVQRPEDGKAVISEDLCTGCGICVKKCPFGAIVIVNLAKELGSEKIHQYGINSFRLYHLPVPKKGAVVGLLGRNGIGKSTIINILSGNIKPNLGYYNNQPEWKDILYKFNGTETKSYFEKISSGALKVSIKPQLVYLIPKTFNGNAGELLNKYDERGDLEFLVNELELKSSLETKVSHLSGGELQRLAVAVACNKDADYYFFDEPSSYNDIYQRLAVARVIKRLADNGKSVMVVEHDLTLLDYLSEYIHILYGEAGAYGIVSPLQSTKVGINNFLEGYIPSDNIRFRDKSFKFDGSRQHGDFILDMQVARFSDLSKSFSSFSLKACSSEIREGEIVGMVGGNALGKTTLMKIVAGVEKPDTGQVELQATVSYKPQYLNQNNGGDTRSFLSTAYGDDIDGSPVEDQILNPMGMKRLYDKNVNTLSGGELQKVAICCTLVRPAKIYAFDEPSAFLDVEDRIFFAKFLHHFIKAEGKSALIVDHDMQLIDLLADSLIIFTGNPGINGVASSIMKKEEGMNAFLREVSITYRRDETSGRARINKEGSRLDKEQKDSGNYYLAKS